MTDYGDYPGYTLYFSNISDYLITRLKFHLVLSSELILQFNIGSFHGGHGARIEGVFTLTKGALLNIVVGQRGGDSVEVKGGSATNQTAASLGQSIEDNAGTGGGGGSFVYSTSNSLYIAAGGGGGASAGVNGVNGQYSNSGATSSCKNTAEQGLGGTGGSAGKCCNTGNYHGGVGAGWTSNGASRQSSEHGEAGGSRAQSWTGGQAGSKNSGNNGGPSPGAVGGFGGGGGGSEDNGASGAGGGYSGGGSGKYSNCAGGGGGSYCSGTSCTGSSGGNTASEYGFVSVEIVGKF